MSAIDESLVKAKLRTLANAHGSYVDTYPHLIEATCELTKLNSPSGYLAIAHMVYGWMPTVLKNFGQQVEQGVVQPDLWRQSLSSLSDLGRMARDAKTLSDAEALIDRIAQRSPINGSWVGLSKFLHFINPELFPIWDSRVAKHWRASDVWHNSQAAYRGYLGFCHRHLESPLVEIVFDELERSGKARCSSIRAIELALFVTSAESGSSA